MRRPWGYYLQKEQISGIIRDCKAGIYTQTEIAKRNLTNQFYVSQVLRRSKDIVVIKMLAYKRSAKYKAQFLPKRNNIAV